MKSVARRRSPDRQDDRLVGCYPVCFFPVQFVFGALCQSVVRKPYDIILDGKQHAEQALT